MANRVSDLPQFGTTQFKCARCDKWWIKMRAELLNEIGDVPLDHAPSLLARCKHAGTFSGCGVYLASKDIHIEESPPGHLRYRWLSQLVKVRATLTARCDGCGRVRTVAPKEMMAWIERHARDGDITMSDLSRRLRCRCGRKGALLEWVAPASGVPETGRGDRDARGSWRLTD